MATKSAPGPNDQRQNVPDFVEPYQEVCPRCNQMLLDPYQTRCGHRLCYECLTTYLDKNGGTAICPFSEEDCEIISLKRNDGSVYPDFYLRKNLNMRKVFCDFKHLGCQDTMPWGRLMHHQKECEYGKVDCPYTTHGCKARPSSAGLEDHVKECLYAPIPCIHCDEPIATCTMEDHMTTCPRIEIECVHNCGMRMLRCEFQDHLHSCPNKPVQCKFKRMGCDFEGAVAVVKEHESGEGVIHLDMVTAHCERLENEMRELKSNQEASVKEREAATRIVEGKLKQHDLKITRHEKILKETQKTVAKQAESLLQSPSLGPMSGDNTFKDIVNVREQLRENMPQLTSLDSTHVVNKSALKKMEEQIISQSKLFSEFDLRIQIIETATYNGVLLWKIGNYRQRKANAKQAGGVQSLYSQNFYTAHHGYRMCARVYLNGDGMGLNNHLSLFFVMMRGEFDPLLKWPFRQKVTLIMMDQSGRNRHIQDTFRPDPSSSSFQKPTSNMNIASGCPMFISHDVLEATDSPYLQDETIFIKVIVDISDLPQ